MSKRVIISGGGTGGHIFPALAIAKALQRIDERVEILFVGAKGRMEMEKVPAAGYQIIGLDIQGIQRNSILKNLTLPFKLLKSIWHARSIVKSFKPDVAVGVGGYASGPLLFAAANLKVPYLIQEQNSYAGLTNKWLAKKADKICVAFEGMETYFPAEKLMLTGNPIRKESVAIDGKREEAAAFFGLSAKKKTILLTGGSLGAGTLNRALQKNWNKLVDAEVQLIWQTGKFYYRAVMSELEHQVPASIKIVEFLHRMDLAYAMADVIISRAGAGTIAELCVLGKPVILVPSPNVAEDHQTKNALSLSSKNAAILVNDADALQTLVPTALDLLKDVKQSSMLSKQIAGLAIDNADEVIAKEIFRLMERKGGPWN
ncbi:MAG: undecaprenyldiphospho-muramoylpentapeptide beta-N-acetylglucosaminyltransferase [Bacteroidota bacterium]|jgi:UDP-N-acetylglucosamine--N-acetylmuramyl-(pentapeptide) pyrophosphoryl-undecaprenol N-acetylglucosamine transferase